MVERILRLPQVKELTGMSRSTIYARIGAGLFPQPIHLGVRMSGWPESEVAAIIAAAIRGATNGEVASLVITMEAERKRAA